MSARLDRRIPAHPEQIGVLRRELVAFAGGLGATSATQDAVALAVSEALTNAVVHADVDRPAGEVVVAAWQNRDGDLLIQICDEGVGMVPRTDSPGLGLGMALIAQMAEDLRLIDRPDELGAAISMRFVLNGRVRLDRAGASSGAGPGASG